MNIFLTFFMNIFYFDFTSSNHIAAISILELYLWLFP